MGAALAGGLLDSLTLSTNPLHLGGVVSALGVVPGLVNNTIKPLLALLDPALDALLSALGVKLGILELWVPGVRCGMVVLVRCVFAASAGRGAVEGSDARRVGHECVSSSRFRWPPYQKK